MLLKNNRSGNAQLFYSTKDQNGPKVDYVHIPGGATVDLKDEIFELLCKPTTLIREQRVEELEIEGDAEIKMDKKNVVIKEFYETGETRVVNLFREQIKAGDFIVVEAPAVAKERMLQVLAQNGVNAEKLSEEQITSLYLKLV